MFGKFVFALIAVCCIAQGFEARNVSPSLSIDDVVKAIEELIQNIKDALAKLPQLIQDLKDKIQDIINKLNIPGMVARIKAEMDKIMKAAGVDFVAAAKCIVVAEKATENLVQEATEGLEKCMGEIENAEKQIEAVVEKLNDEANQIVADVEAQAEKCVKDNGLDVPKVIECLKGVLEASTEKANQLVEDIQQAVETVEKIIEEATNNMSDCVVKIEHDVQQKETQIISEFDECVNDITNPTTVAGQ